MLGALTLGIIEEIRNNALAAANDAKQLRLQTELSESNAALKDSATALSKILFQFSENVKAASPQSRDAASGAVAAVTAIIGPVQDRYRYIYVWQGNSCQGYFAKKPDGEWLEHTSGEGGCLEAAYLFTELGHDTNWINLYDSNRGYYLRLPSTSDGWAELTTSKNGVWGRLHAVVKLGN